MHPVITMFPGTCFLGVVWVWVCEYVCGVGPPEFDVNTHKKPDNQRCYINKYIDAHLEGHAAGEEDLLARLRVEGRVVQVLRRPHLRDSFLSMCGK